MSSLTQPAIKRVRLDASQGQTQGTVIALVRQYVLMVCVLYCSVCIIVISIHFSKAKVILYSQIQHAVLSQVSPTLIRIAHHTVTRCLGSTLEHTYHICTVVGVIIEGLTACMCIGRAFWQETDYFHRCGWLKTC